MAKTYFAPENRTVGLYSRKPGAAAEELPPELAALPAELRQMVQAQIRQLQQVEDAAQLEQIIAQLDGQRGQVPPEMKPALDVVLAAAQQRLAAVSGAASEPEPENPPDQDSPNQDSPDSSDQDSPDQDSPDQDSPDQEQR